MLHLPLIGSFRRSAPSLFWDIQICRFCALVRIVSLLILSPLVIRTVQALCGPLILRSSAAHRRLLLAHFRRVLLVTLSALSPIIPKPSLPAPVDHLLKATLLLTKAKPPCPDQDPSLRNSCNG